VEGQSTLCPSFLSAVDRLFKLHFLFNIAYAAAYEHVWHLLQKCVYVIHDNTSAFASVSNFSAYLNSKRRADSFSRSAVVDLVDVKLSTESYSKLYLSETVP